MAKTIKPTYDPLAQYKVVLADRVDLFGQSMYPGHDVTLRGDVLETINPANVHAATRVAPVPEA